MATYTNRSKLFVKVKQRDDLYREFPFHDTHAAQGYLKQLRADGYNRSWDSSKTRYSFASAPKVTPTTRSPPVHTKKSSTRRSTVGVCRRANGAMRFRRRAARRAPSRAAVCA